MTAFTAVLIYAAWTLLLPIVYAGTIRVPSIASGRTRADHWERGKPNDDPAVLARMKNAHLNCTENFAVFAAIVVVAALLGKVAVVDAAAGLRAVCARRAERRAHHRHVAAADRAPWPVLHRAGRADAVDDLAAAVRLSQPSKPFAKIASPWNSYAPMSTAPTRGRPR